MNSTSMVLHEQMRAASARTHNALLVTNALLIIMLSVYFNSKLGWTKVRIDIRQHSNAQISGEALEQDRDELNVLRELQLSSLDVVDIPALGIRFVHGDIGIIGAIIILSATSWLVLSTKKEKAVLYDILCPLSDHHCEKRYRKRSAEWIESRREDALDLAHVVSHYFLFLTNLGGRRTALFGILLIVIPAMLVTVVFAFDVYWYGIKIWNVTGQSVLQELEQPKLIRWRDRLCFTFTVQAILVGATWFVALRAVRHTNDLHRAAEAGRDGAGCEKMDRCLASLLR